MAALILTLFIVCYFIIAFEHNLHINKAGTAILAGALCWSIYSFQSKGVNVATELSHHLGEISEIIFFLLGAMTIVELIDSHHGFDLITQKITTTNKRNLLIIISLISFMLSAVMDNLTTAIVMATVIKKIIPEKTDRYYFLGLVIISANAGGCFSPIGDVTTTMLWMADKLTAASMIPHLFLPALICMTVPVALSMTRIKGHITKPVSGVLDTSVNTKDQALIFILGISSLLFVPVFKNITHLPPYMGILFGLGLMWIMTEIIHRRKATNDKDRFSVAHAITKTDVPSVLFFLGILLAVACLEEIGLLKHAALWLNASLGNSLTMTGFIGLLSALVDNVPLLAATMIMFDFPTDDSFWEMIAYATGTGGSCLIIGSAAGVAVMGIENITFVWYFKNISFLALTGYIAGFFIYYIQNLIIA